METFIERNYKKEYQNYHSKPEQKKRRAGRNKARKLFKDTKGIVGKDVHHKDNNPLNNDKSNLSVVTQKYNRTEPRLREEDNPRIPRKKGQPANSKKHSDLYTDENPKGTIHGLGFKDVATAKKSVSKIRNSSRSHAHKIQAAVAMEQRAREMGKTSEAAVYRKYINSMKKKTKKMNEEKSGDHEPEMIRSQLKTAGRASKRIEKHSRKKDNFKAWVQSKITKASDYLDTAADYLDSKDMKKEAANPAQQAAIAISMKKKGIKPKNLKEQTTFPQMQQRIRDAKERRREQQKKSEKLYMDTKRKGVKFYDKSGSGRIKDGKKIYD